MPERIKCGICGAVVDWSEAFLANSFEYMGPERIRSAEAVDLCTRCHDKVFKSAAVRGPMTKGENYGTERQNPRPDQQ